MSYYRTKIEMFLVRMGLGMRAKLVSLFVIIKVAPLIMLAFIIWRQTQNLGDDLYHRTSDLSYKTHSALAEIGGIATKDAEQALDDLARDSLERLATDTTQRMATFLYARDSDLLSAAGLTPSTVSYEQFLLSKQSYIIKQGQWELTADKNFWQPTRAKVHKATVQSAVEENTRGFHYRPPDDFTYEPRPLFLEMTFVDTTGQEKIKVVTSKSISKELKNISRKENTFAKAETYFSELKKLKPGEIYVSDVIGSYVPSKIIGVYTPEATQKIDIPFEPEKSAYAGQENPLGQRFKGIIRWATPKVQDGKIIGYVTLALDHDHLMEFTDHISPTTKRYTEIPNAYDGNYAFVWDHKGRIITHPRHHSIVGYDPETGEPQVPWLEDKIYERWQKSGKSYAKYIQEEPIFLEQSHSKKPAKELTEQGLVGLDCRYLNFAPQCTGWFDLTQHGGSGSFTVLWSGLWKLTTVSAIPYYTGQYAASPRGFGLVTVGAEVADFQRPAKATGMVINDLMQTTTRELEHVLTDTQKIISKNLAHTTTSIALTTLIMTSVIVLIAFALASTFTRSIMRIIRGISRFRRGERQFRFNAPVKDEIGTLCDSFDGMADAIVNNVQGTLVIANRKGNIIYANQEALQGIGKTLDDVVGQPYIENNLMGKNNPLSAQAVGQGVKIYYNETTARHHQALAEDYKNEEGITIGYIITSTDVTQMVNEQKQIEEQRTLLSTIFTSSPDCLWYKNKDGRYLLVNPRFAAVAHNNLDDITGRTAQEILPKELAVLDEANERIAIEQNAYLAEERLTHPDGRMEVMEAVRTPIYDAKGCYCGLLGVARDVTDRVRIEQDLRETQKELKSAVEAAIKASESKSGFLARMSHEIRTPMNAVLGMSTIARRKLDAPQIPLDEVRTHIDQIETSAQHLLGLLNEILEISKIEAGKIELVTEVFDLEKLITDVVTIIEPRCSEKNISFVEKMPTLSCTHFSNDALRLRQVLINILGNAIKFTPEEGEVIFSVTQKDTRLGEVLFEFAVHDSGIGISPETLATLFTPFEQGTADITRKFGGTGLGLAISKSIVKLMGGDILVTSEEGKGSTFAFAIWLKEAAREAEHVQQLDYSILKGKNLLLVDDVDINRLIVVEMLREFDMTIDEAENGKLAVDTFAASAPYQYDAILMDIQMPIMNGYEASVAIRALDRPDAAAVPIIALTANSFKEDVQKAMQNGMTAHLAKPIEYDRLLEILAKTQ